MNNIIKLAKKLWQRDAAWTLSEELVEHKTKLNDLQKRISYIFKDKNLLLAALTHTSWHRHKNGHPETYDYERMEFFGDAVLELISVEYLFINYPTKNEGYLSKIKSQIVSENYLSIKAKQLELGSCIILGEEEIKAKGYEKKSILANMMESLICAIYVDGGLEKARKFVNEHVLKDFEEEIVNDVHTNYKSILQEYSQSKHQKLPLYRLISETGPDHHKTFTVVVSLMDKEVGAGTGFSKKEAEQNAAKEGCLKLGL